MQWKESTIIRENKPFAYTAHSVKNIGRDRWWGASVMQNCGNNTKSKWKALIFVSSEYTHGMNISESWPRSGKEFNDLKKAQKACETFLKKSGFDLKKQIKVKDEARKQ